MIALVWATCVDDSCPLLRPLLLSGCKQVFKPWFDLTSHARASFVKHEKHWRHCSGCSPPGASSRHVHPVDLQVTVAFKGLHAFSEPPIRARQQEGLQEVPSTYFSVPIIS